MKIEDSYYMTRHIACAGRSYRLKDAVLEGTESAFNKAYGTRVYEYCGKDPRFNSIFNEAMSNHSTITVRKILDNYDGFKDLSSLVDVGGGIEVTLSMIVSKYPTIKGINFDLSHIVENAASFSGISADNTTILQIPLHTTVSSSMFYRGNRTLLW
ncbi:hypothetical protein Nepgr_031383 [Nepenthes gracilis]|uniref:O-methyltransferase C-terminal domain-containing protein n=1 Tax=Nepenthes gracilis TaxID=150966 RepID=A0AAD3TGL8_NEPGR|nr:hypothetical protein Nepgr_031383 [Nepenthes gracilis]